MHKHTIRYSHLPEEWAHGFPLGNGEIGVMCWSEGEDLRFTLDSARAWDLRGAVPGPAAGQPTYQQAREWIARGDFQALASASAEARDALNKGLTKLYLGRMDLAMGQLDCTDFSLSLPEATVSAKLSASGAEVSMQAFVSRDRDVLCIRLDPWPEQATMQFLPFYETSPGLAELGHPEVKFITEGDLTIAVQHILPDVCFAICWNATGPDIFVAVANAPDEEAAVSAASGQHSQAALAGFATMQDEHRQAWGDFWSTSMVAVPEKDYDFLWHHGLYILAGCARRGSWPPGLQGLWAMDGQSPPWHGDYHTDMNVQETFWPAYASNHIDLADSWLDHMHESLPRAEEFTRAVFGTRGAFHLTSYLPNYTPICTGYPALNYAWSNTGWLAHLAWMRWRYTMDTEWLAEIGHPIVRSAFLFFSDNLELENDGHLHIPLSDSPEYEEGGDGAWCKDPNIDIALVRKSCDWMLEMEAALGLEELSERAEEILDKLVPYHLVGFEHTVGQVRGGASADPYVLGLWEGKCLDQPHRHPSHLMAIHPAMDLTIDGSDRDRAIIESSLRHYISLGHYCWAGHTYAQMVSMAAVTGKGEMSYNFLRCYRDRWILPNGMHLNREWGYQGNTQFFLASGRYSDHAPLTIESNCGISCGISDMLVQGWGGRIRVFPAVPSRWRDMAFAGLLTEGAFEVSALMRDGRVRWVQITARVDGPCALRDPFDDEVTVSGCSPEHEGEDFKWVMSAGKTVTFSTPGWSEPDLEREAADIRSRDVRWLSLG